jgi:hypothetical protein
LKIGDRFDVKGTQIRCGISRAASESRVPVVTCGLFRSGSNARVPGSYAVSIADRGVTVLGQEARGMSFSTFAPTRVFHLETLHPPTVHLVHVSRTCVQSHKALKR